MKTGHVKWFSKTKGYGYIKPLEGGEDIFVFYPSIEQEGYRNLFCGQKVKYEAVSSNFGQRTTRVVPKV